MNRIILPALDLNGKHTASTFNHEIYLAEFLAVVVEESEALRQQFLTDSVLEYGAAVYVLSPVKKFQSHSIAVQSGEQPHVGEKELEKIALPVYGKGDDGLCRIVDRNGNT